MLFANASSHGPRQRRTVFTLTLRSVEVHGKFCLLKGVGVHHSLLRGCFMVDVAHLDVRKRKYACVACLVLFVFSSLLLFGTSCGHVNRSPKSLRSKKNKSQMKHSRRSAFSKCGKCSMCTYDRFKVHKMYPKMHSKPTTQTCKGCTIPIGTELVCQYIFQNPTIESVASYVFQQNPHPFIDY